VGGGMGGRMQSLGHEATAAGVARLYGDLADVFVVAPGDEAPAQAVAVDIDMVRPDVRAEVGRQLLEALL
jgi:hypothetical protein